MVLEEMKSVATGLGSAARLAQDITKRRPLKLIGRKKWGTHDALRANKAVPPLSVLFDLKT